MRNKIIAALLAICFIAFQATAQGPAPRQLPAVRIKLPVKIDGILDDSAWKSAAVMTDMVEFRPKVGAKEEYAVRTEAYLMYDDEGLYFGGYCHERTKDSIASELVGRDGFGTNDYIGIILDTYHDKLNGFEYFVTPVNEQWDAKMSPGGDNGGEDFSWNAVWKSGVVVHNDGWSFEMFIPYSAIRFGKTDIQNWGLNITRRRRKTEQQNTWNPIDPNVNGFLTQEGVWTNITHIKPPLRLQFSPYFSIYANHYPYNIAGEKNWTSQVNGGMDVKYGINQAFTLDATLIPDFGQVQSDNQVLNLTPFEVKFNENRSFFTEGTELFNKGNFFYSRRIGGTPIHLYDVYGDVGANEEVLKNPSESKLINASKVSGRTKNGLGIGLLNAVTKPQYAIIHNTVTGQDRKVQTDPLTNYNIFVLNQSLKHNSSVSLINTNVWRSGIDYDANVTAALFDLNDKKNMWNVGGKFAVSSLMGYPAKDKNLTGFNSSLYFGKISGRFNFNFSQEITDTKFSSNDLGYFTNNNYISHYLYMGYRWTEPRQWYNNLYLNFNATLNTLYTKIKPIDQSYQQLFINANINGQTKKLQYVGLFADFRARQNDFYEPRITGYFFRRGTSFGIDGWFGSNESKKYSLYTELFYRKYINFYNISAYDLTFNQNYRFSGKLSVGHNFHYSPTTNSIGFAAINGNDIIFGRRNINTIENILNVKYNFTNRMGITFRARHYISSVKVKEFFTLQQLSGKLIANSSFNQNVDRNVNFFNIDMVYTWQFAPGSFINIVWKEAAFTDANFVEKGYFRNFSHTLDADDNNNLSLKVIYFLDYLQLKGHKKKI